ncbi:MAG: hypothetical protein IH985_02915 [Planctomycetes bacterium]|nr:hypothetical protein [Planctomycetota bacterium]
MILVYMTSGPIRIANVISVPTLGERVKADRDARGISRVDFAGLLAEAAKQTAGAEGRKLDVNWVINLENNRLRKPAPDVIRSLLASALDQDPDLYRSLPMQRGEYGLGAAEVPTALDPYAVARLVLENIPPGSQVLFDNPPTGPLSARYPQALDLVFRIVAQRRSNLVLYSNEDPETQADETMHCTANILLLAALLHAQEPFVGSPSAVGEYLSSIPLGAVSAASEQTIGLRTRRDDAIRHELTRAVAEHLTRAITIFERSRAPSRDERINPLTIVLIKFARATELGQAVALSFDEHRYCRKLEDQSRVENYFQDRADRGVVRRRLLSVDCVLECAVQRQTPIELVKP